jgi:hypothetical protein
MLASIAGAANRPFMSAACTSDAVTIDPQVKHSRARSGAGM